MTVTVRRPVSPLARFTLRQHGLVTRAQAVGAGCTDDVLQRLCREGVLLRADRGVYRLSGVPRSFEQRVLAACLARAGVACRMTAARLYGFEVDTEAPLEILCHRDRRAPASRGYRVHTTGTLTDGDIVVRRGIQLTSPVRTLRDVAPLTSAGVLDRFLGHLLASRDLTAAQLTALATPSAGVRRRGQRVLREAVERAGVTVAPDSVLEHRALLLLRAAGLPEPASQLPIHREGRLVGIVDFAWPSAGVVLEVDGYRWHADPRTFDADRRRDNALRELGWTVYRTTWSELASGAGALLRQLRTELERRRRPG